MPHSSRFRVALSAAATLAAAPLAAQSLVAGAPFESRMFRFDPAHTGVANTEGVPRLGGVAWTFETGGPVRSTPALAGGTLYVGSADGFLYAVRAADGGLRWRFEAEGPVLSSPAVTDRLVIFGDRSNTLRALDRADGRLVWERRTGPDRELPWGWEGWDYLTASPVLVPGADGGTTVLFGSGDGLLLAVHAETGNERWRFETAGRIRGTPAVSGGLAYVGAGDGIVYAIDVATGRERWRYETSGVALDAADFGFDRRQIQASPVVTDGTVYIGSRDASLYALDAGTGRLRWHREDGSAWVVGSAAVRGERLFNGRSSSGWFRSIDAATGDEVWGFNTGGAVFSSPVIVDDLVYVGSGSGFVYALEAETGVVRWQFPTGGSIYSSPVVADGRVYVGSDDGNVYALERGTLPNPHLAVFFDDSLTNRAAWGGAPHHRVAVDYFARRGYRVLDGRGLAEFLAARATDGEPSAVVFAMDAVPEEVAATPTDTGLVRRYLRQGGKIVWLGYPPFALARGEDGRITGLDREGSAGFLDVDLTPWNTDLYYAQPTATGREWGWERWVVAHPVAAAQSVDVVLARDELGSAAAWVRSFGGPPGTGLVFLPATTDRRRLDEVRQVTEYGLMRPAQMHPR